MKSNNKGLVRNKIMLAGIICRMTIIFSPIAFKIWGGLRWDEFIELLYITTPVSILYLTLFFKHRLKHPYHKKGQPLPDEYVGWGYNLILGFNVAEIALILARSLFSLPGIDWFYGMIWLVEIFLAGYAGSFLSVLFNDQVE